MFFYIVVLIVIVFLLDQCRPRRFVKFHQQIGNDWTYLPILGHSQRFIGSNEDVFKSFFECSKELIKKGGILSFWLGYKFMIVIGDPMQTAEILKSALDKTILLQFMGDITGNGSVFAPGEISLRRRKIIIPTFALRHVSKFINVFEANAKEVADQFESKVGKGNFSCWDCLCRSAADSVCECILGKKVGALKQPNHPFAVAFQQYLEIVANRMMKPWLYLDALFKLFPVYARQERAKKVAQIFIDDIIGNKLSSKEKKHSNIENGDKKFTSFLDLIIESSEESGKRFTPEELREESLVFAVAGTDTSATGVCFTLLLLSQHQDVQEKVYNELQEVFDNEEKTINYEDLTRLKYVEAVVKEILRLYPPIPLIVRDSQKDFVLPSGLQIPNKSNLIVDVRGIHRNPQYWGDDAEEFKPERFLSGQIPAGNSYMPFGFGPRNCPGSTFALLSMKTTVATILRRYRLLPATSFKYDKNNPLRLSFSIVTKHVNNFEIQIDHRNKENLKI